MAIKRIAVLGLGKVGTLAAQLLHDSGFEVTGIDLSPASGKANLQNTGRRFDIR